MATTYKLEPDLSVQEFRDVLAASTLGERRPVSDLGRLERMLRHADIIVVARDDGQIVGVSRALRHSSWGQRRNRLSLQRRLVILKPCKIIEKLPA